MGVLQFILYIAVLAVIVALICLCAKGIGRLQEVNEDLEDAERDIFDARMKLEHADELANRVSGPVKKIGKEITGDGSLGKKVRNIAKEAAGIKSTVNDLKRADDTSRL